MVERAKDIDRQLNSVGRKLSELIVEDAFIWKVKPKNDFCLVGSIWMEKEYNKEAMKWLIRSLWKVTGTL